MPLVSKQSVNMSMGPRRAGRHEVDRRFVGDFDVNEDRRFLAYCCSPSGCPRRLEDPIDARRPGDAIKVSCSDKRCDSGNWMHTDCFVEWEEEVLAYLCSCGRAKGWSDKQKHQNVWTRKGYDLVYKACLCMCGHGYLRRDLSYTTVREEPRKKPSKKDRREPEELRIMTSDFKPYTRMHRSSLSSSGSSPPSSTGTPPSGSPGGWFNFTPQRPVVDFFADAQQAATGNIFAHRTDLAVFKSLPRRLWNAYNIRSEDEGPHGTDETRSFVLTTLSTKGVTSVHCVLCQTPLVVYDKYPLIDGTFFLSPQRYDRTLAVVHKTRPRYLGAVCMFCMHGVKGELRCRTCQSRWDGSILVVGSMYSYDIFSAAPCCPARLSCNQCGLEVLGPNGKCPQFYSDYSESFVCQHCHADDNHFAKPLGQIFSVVK